MKTLKTLVATLLIVVVGYFSLLSPTLFAQTGGYSNIVYSQQTDLYKQVTYVNKCRKGYTQHLKTDLNLYDDQTAVIQFLDENNVPTGVIFEGSWSDNTGKANTVIIALSGEIKANQSTKSIGQLISTIEQNSGVACNTLQVNVVDPSVVTQIILKINKKNNKGVIKIKTTGVTQYIGSKGVATSKFTFKGNGTGLVTTY